MKFEPLHLMNCYFFVQSWDEVYASKTFWTEGADYLSWDNCSRKLVAAPGNKEV